jgi:hypothetical protein
MTIKLDAEIAEQLRELSRITKRDVNELANDALAPIMKQAIDDKDTDFIRIFFDGARYKIKEEAEEAATNFNVIEATKLSRHGRQFVRIASVIEAKDGFSVIFSEAQLETV